MLKVKRFSNNVINRWFWGIDIVILAIVVVLLAIGILLSLSATPYLSIRFNHGSLYFFKRHLGYVTIAFLALISSSFFSIKQIKQLAIFLFILGILGVVFTLVASDSIKGARRWIHFLGFSIQPSDFVEVCFPIILALIYNKLEPINRKIAYIAMVAIYAFTAILIILQPDFGMTILISVIFIAVLFVTGINFFWILIMAFFGLILLLIAYFSFSHVRYRVYSFFSGDKSYQVKKSIAAIRDGGIFGSNQGQVKAYLPDAHTDFIFSVATEDYGILFAIILIMIYLYLFLRCFNLLKFEKRRFNYLASVGFVVSLIMQTFIHMSTNVNLLPAKGATLPFISYGGTSLLVNALLIGFLLALTRKKYYGR